MNYDKETLEQISNDPFMKALANLFGITFEESKKTPEPKEDSFSALEKRIKNTLDRLEKEGKLKSYEKDGAKYYYTPNEEPVKEEVKKPVSEVKPNFVMSEQEFSNFVKSYRELLDALAKLRYLYGIDVSYNGGSYSLEGKVREIIWTFLRIIFGEDNLEDIADFIYSNDSNFDSAKELYNELT